MTYPNSIFYKSYADFFIRISKTYFYVATVILPGKKSYNPIHKAKFSAKFFLGSAGFQPAYISTQNIL
jgi:hypothetical protein